MRTEQDWQLVLVDLPGVQRPLDQLTARMQRRVELELKECDSVLFVLAGDQKIGPGDRFIAEAIVAAGVPVTVVVSKVDVLDRPRTVLALAATAELGLDGEVFPVSAAKGTGVDALVSQLVSQLSEGPFHFEVDATTDLSERVRIAETVREQILARTRQEVPHAVEVEVEELDESRDDLVVIRAVVLVESRSQKGILIGSGGQMIKTIGTAARRELERELSCRVHLELAVRVREDWRGDERTLDRLGLN